MDDGEMPLSGLPKTGDSFSKSTFTMIMASVLLVLASINKKRKENS
ncbi:LPXTG cell wall anchor domain-containing protein [Enterocloster bolteae]